jgi:hypothetical protein
MRCVTCGAEMILVKVVPDETMIVEGFERYTLQCLECGEIEQRFVFKNAAARAAESAAQAAEGGSAPAPSGWTRAVERLRERQGAATVRSTTGNDPSGRGHDLRTGMRAVPGEGAGMQGGAKPHAEAKPGLPALIPASKPPAPSREPRAPAATTADAGFTGGSKWTCAVAKLRQWQDRG